MLTKMRRGRTRRHSSSTSEARCWAGCRSCPTAGRRPCRCSRPAPDAARAGRPARQGGAYRIPLLNQVMVLADPADAPRRGRSTHAAAVPATAGDGLLDVARQDLAGTRRLEGARAGRQGGVRRPLPRRVPDGEEFRRFDRGPRPAHRTCSNCPGAGRALATALGSLRLPYRWPRDRSSTKALARPAAVNVGEAQVLDGAFRGWLDQLRAEAIRSGPTASAVEARRRAVRRRLAPRRRDQFQRDCPRSFQLS